MSLSVFLLLLSFWGPSSLAQQDMILGGIAPAAAVSLATITLSETEATMGVLGVVGALLAYHFLFQKYIRQAAGVKEEPTQTQTQILEQPVKVQSVARYVAHEELDIRLSGYVTSDELHATELRIDAKIDENFKALDGKRSKSIGNLHEHLTKTGQRIDDKIDQELGKTHNRIDALAGKQGELIGEIRHLTTAVDNAAKAAQAAAVAAAAASKGGKA